MIKLLGYDFVTKEKLTWFKQRDMIIDDVAVVRRNRHFYHHRRSSSIIEDGNQQHISNLNRRQCHSLQPDAVSLSYDSSECMANEASMSPLQDCHDDCPREKPPALQHTYGSATRNSSISGTNTKGTGRKRLFALASKSFKLPFANFRRMSEPGMITTASSSGLNNNQLIQRCVIIQRDDTGYGLTVSGDNPVFVQSVKEDGAAARAGVRQGDRIIKVNGTLVTNSNHMDVVKMISAGNHVALTLLGRPSHPYTGPQQRPVSLLHQASSDRLCQIQQSGSHYEVSGLAGGSSTFPAPSQHHPMASASHQQLHYVGSPPSTSSTASGSSPSPCGAGSTSSASSTGVGVRRSATTVGAIIGPVVDTGKEFITGPQPVDCETSVEREALMIFYAYNRTSGSGNSDSPNSSGSTSAASPGRKEQKQAEWKRKRILIIQQMLEEEKKHVEELRSELKGNPNSQKAQQLYEQAQKRIRNLQGQLSDFGMPMATAGGARPAATTQTGRQVKQADGVTASAAAKQTAVGKSHPQSVSVERPVESTDRGPPSTHDDRSAKEQTIHFISPAQIDVIPMEDSDSDTETAAPLDTEGPFSNFAELKGRPAHLAVFLHYLISNSDPASLLFYLVTDFYSQGNGKDLRKWAYEIHSSFLVPTAPLRVSCIENEVWQEVENVLNSSSACEAEEVMKRLFVRARQKALDEINEHLADFRNKRTLGLGNVFGESMLQGLMFGDSVREKKIVDALLTQHFESFFSGISDFDSLPDRTQVLAASLATTLRHMGVKPSCSLHEKLLDKCPSYAAKEKVRFGRPLLAKPSKKAVQIKGHHFMHVPVYSSTKCYQCAEMIWGLNAHAYACSNCDVVVHKQCAGSLEDACYGGGGISHRRSLTANAAHYAGGKKLVPKNAPSSQLPNTPSNRSNNDGTGTDSTLSTPSPVGCVSPSVSIPTKNQHHRHSRRHAIAEEPEDGSVSESPPTAPSSAPNNNIQLSADDLDELCDHATALPCSPPVGNNVPGGAGWTSKATWSSADSGYGGDNLAVMGNNAAAIIGRSQSMRSRDEQVRMTRKNSTESNGRRTKSDVDADKAVVMAQVATGGEQQQTASATADMSVSSSSSSVSRNSLPESPTASTDALRPHQHQSMSSSVSPQSSTTVIPSPQLSSSTLTVTGDLASTTGAVVLPGSDSDLEAETECPLLEDVLDWETIRHLKPKEKKRQEVINELFHTERTHVRNLKVLHKLFYERLLAHQILPPDFIKLLFSNIEDVLDIHMKMNSAMKSLTKQSKLVGDIGEMMLAFFDGEEGENFGRAVATFCQHQQHALEALKLRQKKDQKLAQFLQEAEGSTICRKLQLKDMLPMEMQRLTKYPLLMETVYKYTAEPSEEAEKLHKCMDCARRILDAVNTAKRKSENARRLEDLHKRVDTTAFDKVQHPMVHDYRCLDLRQYKLLHEGALTWRLGKNKAVDLHVVLLEDLLMLLTRNSDGQRLSLRFHNITFGSGKEDTKFTHCPLLKLSSLMAKNVATDKRAFFLVSTSALGPQIYELVAQSTSEKKTWFKFITEQIDICKRADAAASGHGGRAASASALLSGAAKSAAQTPKTAAEPGAPEHPESAPLSDTARKLSEAGLTLSAAAAATTHVDDELAPVERVQIISQPRLINPSEVLVCQPTVLEHAEPVLTPLERLRRKDEAIMRALLDKQKILAKIFDLPTDELDLAVESVMDSKSSNKEARELALAAIVQTNRLLEAINASMKLRQEEEAAREAGEAGPAAATDKGTSAPIKLVVTEKPAVPCSKLTLIAAPLMKHLSSLLHSLQFMEEDLKRVRQELHQYKERLGESSENSSPAGSFRKPSTSSSCSGAASGRSRTSEKQCAGARTGCGKPPPTTNIDEYLATSCGDREKLPKLTVDRCSGSDLDARSTGERAETRSDSGANPGFVSDRIQRSASGGSVRSGTDDSHLGLGASATTPAVSPLSTMSSPETRSSPRTTPAVERPAPSTSPRPAAAAVADRAGSCPPCQSVEKPPSSLQMEGGRKEKSAPTSGEVKSPESNGEGDEEKRRERRRQKRQRHTALSGLEGSPRHSPADASDSDKRKMSLEEEDEAGTPAPADEPAKKDT